MSGPLLSVVVPTRDRSVLLPAAVRSVVDSASIACGAEVEVVVVDDASTDSTPDVVRHLEAHDPRVRGVRLHEAAGPSAARNRGLDAARGELVGFLDDDDEWLPAATSTALRCLASRPELGGVTAWHEVSVPGAPSLAYRGPLGYDHRDLLWCNFPASLFCVLRRDRFGDELRFDEELLTCEDWDLYTRCSRRAPIATVPAALYRYHQRAGLRLNADVSRRLEGRARFLAKHEDEMGSPCRAYHRARLEIMATRGLSARARLALSLGRRVPPAVLATIGAESGSARIGRLTADPGRSARTLLRLTRRLG